MIFARSLLAVLCVALAILVGCGVSGDGGSGDPVDAPVSLNGRTIDCTITSGSGAFDTTGTFTIFILFPFSSRAYEIERNGIGVVTNSGTFTYTAVGAVGTMSFADNVIGDGSFVFTYTMRDLGAPTSAGTFSANAVGGGTQTGTFVSTEPPVKVD